MNTNNLHRLIVKYLSKQASFSERKELEQRLKKPENFEIFKAYVKTNYLINLNKDAYDAEDSKRQLLSLIEKEKKRKNFLSFAVV